MRRVLPASPKLRWAILALLAVLLLSAPLVGYFIMAGVHRYLELRGATLGCPTPLHVA